MNLLTDVVWENKMDFKEYQDKSANTAIYLNKVKQEFPELDSKILRVLGISYAALGMGEAGEIQGKIKKIIRDSGGTISDEIKHAIGAEIGDLLWYCAAMCRELEISLEQVAIDNIEKLQSRKDRNVLTGSGDNR